MKIIGNTFDPETPKRKLLVEMTEAEWEAITGQETIAAALRRLREAIVHIEHTLPITQAKESWGSEPWEGSTV